MFVTILPNLDKAEFRRKLHMAVVKAHVSIRKATLEAIVTVQKKNHKARVYVYRMLKKLGVSMGMFIDFINKS